MRSLFCQFRGATNDFDDVQVVTVIFRSIDFSCFFTTQAPIMMKRHFTISFWSHSVFKQKTLWKKRLLPESQRVTESWRGRRKLFYERIIICIFGDSGVGDIVGVGDVMLLTDFRCWWQNHYIGDFFRYVGYFLNVLNLSPTTHSVSNIRHQHRCNRIFFTRASIQPAGINSKRVAMKDRVCGRSNYNIMSVLAFSSSFSREFLAFAD